jgi:hypothetical protein
MSSAFIVRIDSADGRTRGWQARAYTEAPVGAPVQRQLG